MHTIAVVKYKHFSISGRLPTRGNEKNYTILVLVLFNYHIIHYAHFRDFKQKIYNKIKIAKIVKLLDWGLNWCRQNKANLRTGIAEDAQISTEI